ncbi:phosphodiester glycosidase family protein [Clostridium beijerinckii]|uniref:Exopolysaccharide biosynthesis protein n=1 Tax=Clostridium beijerinckii TaxID=1520 RepID=A0A7X9XQT7_CLOBE|nr:phosphodiester glycosidase family protein [Clostridium beijerinckii]NMF06738.1 exopolysaccharide biosynthesis protein [Clostridium beijerinckii]
MNKYGIHKKNSERVMSKPNSNRKNKKKLRFTNMIFFMMFELIFIVCTFPFLLLYGPFENAKRTFVGSAMGTMNTQYLATLFLSEEKINSIIGKTSSDTENGTTNISNVKIPKIKDDSIEFYEIADNPKYKGYYLVIKDPTRVKIGVSSKLQTEGETTSQIAQNNDAIAAVNGGAFVDKSSVEWTGTGAFPDGIVMSDGKEVWNSLDKDGKTDLFGINKEGALIVGKYSENQLKELGVQEALSFGPTLVVNGKETNITIDGGIAPRTAIGQREDGAIILMVIDGRSLTSLGATYKEVQEVIYKLGAINAINLDGGKSTTLYYDGEVRNAPSNSMGERTIPTAVIVK